MKKGLVSIIIPTKNSSALLDVCLHKLRQQAYKRIEILIVDGGSSDLHKIKKLVKKYSCKLLIFDPKVKKGLFDATKKRNFAAEKVHGEYVYHYDADMEMTKFVISEAVKLCTSGFDSVIVTEDSFGIGPWAKAKNLERRFFWGDDLIESPRFFKMTVWQDIGGYDDTIAGGGDDRDIHQKLLRAGYHVARTTHVVMHNEGNLTLLYLMKKQFMYKREILKYIKKRPITSVLSYFPVRKNHFTKLSMFAKRPKDTFFFFIMKTAETLAGMYGIFYSLTVDR